MVTQVVAHWTFYARDPGANPGCNISDTSRNKGDGEIDGQDYNFVSR